MIEKKLGIILDSFSAATDEEIKKHNFHILKLKVTVDGIIQEDKIGHMNETDRDAFWNASELKTSLPSLNEINETLELASKNFDEVLALVTPSGLSSTFSVVSAAAQNFDNVHVIDHNFSGGALFANALAFAQEYENGLEIEKIKEIITKRSKKTNTFVILESLNFIAKGGRLQFIPKPLLKMIKINPIIHFYKKNKLVAFRRKASAAAEVVFKKMIDIIDGIHNFKNYELHLVHFFEGEILSSIRKIFTNHGIIFKSSLWGSKIVMAHSGPLGVGLTLTPKVKT